MVAFNIQPPENGIKANLTKKIDSKTKPTGALGRLEELALRIGLIQGTTSPVLKKPVLVVFAGDHGITAEGISAYPQEVTYQMVLNFLTGGAAINVFCTQNDIALKIIDAGVNYDFVQDHRLIAAKVRKGTRNFRYEPAMTPGETAVALQNGAAVARQICNEGSNIIGFGEMGIGNTTAASAMMSVICQIPVADCVGQGTGLDAEGVRHKAEIIREAIRRHRPDTNPLTALQVFGGYEIAQLAGAMLAAAEARATLLVDGFISTTAFLLAHALEPAIMHYAVFCHKSNETAHQRLLDFLGAKPLLDLSLRLGEGTGAAVAYPIIKSAVAFLNRMASFESAVVTEKTDHAQ